MNRALTRALTISMAAIAAVVCGAPQASAKVPGTLMIQGALTAAVGGVAADGDYQITFALYGAKSGGAAIWAEDPTKVAVKAGLFGHTLGSQKPLTPALLASVDAIWFGMAVGADPELPRVPLHAVAFALQAELANGLACSGCVTGEALKAGTVSADKVGFTYAGAKTKGGPADVALDLQCTGCVAISELKLDGDLDLGGNALKAKSVSAQTLTGTTVTAQSYLGDGSKLIGIKIPSGDCKAAGEVVKGIAPDGALVCVKAMDPNGLPADGLNEISNELLTNQFVDTSASGKTPVDIPDNNPTGVGDVIEFPDVGIAQKLTVSAHITNSDLKTVELRLFDPNNAKYVLFDKGGAGTKLETTWPTPSKTISGDLSTWIGKNPKGKWRLVAVDTGFKNNGSDGRIESWNVSIQTLSSKKVASVGMLLTEGGLRLQQSDKHPVSCTPENFGYVYANPKSNAIYICNGKEFYPISLVPVGTQSNPGLSCKDILTKAPSSTDGVYWITGVGLGEFQVYCDMTTDGGGWTHVRTVAPNDGNSVGYNNQGFWTTNAPYGAFDKRFSNDFKSEADYRVSGTHLMIQSAAPGASGAILGWRRWPMLNDQPRTFDSFFSPGIVGVHGTDSCETGAPDKVDVGSTSSWDEIIRRGGCLYADVNPSSSGQGDTIRLTVFPYNNSDNNMAGFATCIDCGAQWQGGDTYMGLDRAGCNTNSCHYNKICRMPGPPAADCKGNYCGSTYSKTSCGMNWTSRFYVR